MEIDLSKKLVFLLRGKLKSKQVFNIEEIESFINKIKKDLVPFALINYLYNYLYTFCVQNKIAIKFHNNTIVLVELSEIEERKQYNFIGSSKIGDVKHLKINIVRDKTTGKFIAIKELHYALDSCIDLVVLSRLDNSVYSENKNPNEIFNEEYSKDDYTEISFIDYNDPTLFETHSLSSDEKNKNQNSKQRKSELNNKNITSYTKIALKELAFLFKSQMKPSKDELLSNEGINIDDAKTLVSEKDNKINLGDVDLNQFYEKIK